MYYKEHCNLCGNLKTTLQDGIICGLTNQKPEFKRICPNIILGKEFKEKIGLLHIEIESLKKKKKLIYIYFLIYLIIGSLLILSLINSFIGFEYDFTYNKSMDFLGYLLLMFLGLKLLGTTYIKLSQHRKKTKIVKDEKDRIDAVLNKYQIEYSCNVKFGEKYHGNQDVIVEFKSNCNLLKDSKINFHI